MVWQAKVWCARWLSNGRERAHLPEMDKWSFEKMEAGWPEMGKPYLLEVNKCNRYNVVTIFFYNN